MCVCAQLTLNEVVRTSFLPPHSTPGHTFTNLFNNNWLGNPVSQAQQLPLHLTQNEKAFFLILSIDY